MRDREKERDGDLYPLDHSLNGRSAGAHPIQRQDPGVSSGSLLGAKAQGLEPASTIFPSQKQGVGLELQQLEHEPMSLWVASVED